MRTFFLTFLYLCAWQVQAQDVVKSLVDSHELLRRSPEKINELGPKLLTQTQDWLRSRDTDRAALSSEDGRIVQQINNKLQAYFIVKEKLSACVKKDNARKIENQVLQGALTSEAAECGPLRDEFITLRDGTLEILEKMKSAQDGTLKARILDQSMVNAGKTYLSLLQRYEPKFDPKKAIDELEFKFCAEKYQAGCTSDVLKYFRRDLEAYAAAIKGMPKVTIKEATQVLNKNFDHLNYLLKKIPIRTKDGVVRTPVWDSSDPNLEYEFTKEGHEAYVKEYMKAAAGGDGLLLFTEGIREKSGGVKQLAEKDMNEETHYLDQTKFSFKLHSKISEVDVKAGIAEAKAKVFEGIKRFQSMHADQRDGLTAMVSSNPIAVGQTLAKHPELAERVCESINKIDELAKKRKSRDEAWMWGGLIVGGGLMATGVGFGVGAWMVAGTATAVSLGSTATGLLIAGSVAGAIEGGYQGVSMFERHKEFRDHEASVLTRNTDFAGVLEMQKAQEEYKEARLAFGIAVGATALDLGALKLAMKIVKNSSKAISDVEITKNLSEILRVTSQQKQASRLKEVVKLLGEGGAQKLDRFMGILSTAPEAYRVRMLEHLASSKFSPKKFKDLVEEALRLTEGTCKL